VRPPQAER